MQQAQDFLDESEVLYTLAGQLSDADFEKPTGFKGWTVNDIFAHLHFWNLGADLSLNDPDAFTAMISELFEALNAGKLRSHENAKVTERGSELLAVFAETYRDMGRRWAEVDPKTRVRWAGPDMSVRSCMSARQMEVWAHGQAVFDLLGEDRPESDRIGNIVRLGVNAFGWSHKVHGLEMPEEMPKLALTAPSGALWEFGEGSDTITGNAVEFCQVVTQTRNIADTSLVVNGEVAGRWMAHAQCFAGPPETPPAPGERKKA